MPPHAAMASPQSKSKDGNEKMPKNIITISSKIVHGVLRQIGSPHAQPRPVQMQRPSQPKKDIVDRVTHEAGMVVPPDLKKCNCKNSRCLKLYCDCFRARVFCQVSFSFSSLLKYLFRFILFSSCRIVIVMDVRMSLRMPTRSTLPSNTSLREIRPPSAPNSNLKAFLARYN